MAAKKTGASTAQSTLPEVGAEEHKTMGEFYSMKFAPAQFGRGGSAPTVNISGMGRLNVSKIASEALIGCTKVTVAYDKDTAKLEIRGYAEDATVKGMDADNFLKINWPKASKAKLASIPGAGLLHWIEAKQGSGYNFKSAGSQTFPAEVVVKSKLVTFELPKVTPAAKEAVKRGPRKPKVTTLPGDVAAPAAEQAPAAVGEFKTSQVA